MEMLDTPPVPPCQLPMPITVPEPAMPMYTLAVVDTPLTLPQQPVPLSPLTLTVDNLVPETPIVEHAGTLIISPPPHVPLVPI